MAAESTLKLIKPQLSVLAVTKMRLHSSQSILRCDGDGAVQSSRL